MSGNEQGEPAEAMTHLGNILACFAELDEDQRCDAFVKALDFYNEQNPDRKVEAEPGFMTKISLVSPNDDIARVYAMLLERLKLKYAADCKCGHCHLAFRAGSCHGARS